MSKHAEQILPRFWKASWIWPRDRREPNLHLLFRKDFELVAVPEDATLYIAVESSARIVLNGQEIGRTSPNSYPHQHYYESFDCRSALKPGLNRLAIVARYIGIPSSASVPKDPGLLAELVLDDATTGSDASWRCLELKAWVGNQRRSEWLNLDQVEVVDRRLLPAGFPYPEDESGFVAPESLPWPGVRFTAVEPRPFSKALPCGEARLQVILAGTVSDRSRDNPIPALAVSEEEIIPQPFAWDGHSPFVVPAQSAGTAFALLFTFGEYLNGRPEIELDGPAGAVVDIVWEERLINGRFDVRKTRVYTADRHILAGGFNRIVPGDWLAGHFMQLTFRNLTAPVKVSRLRYRREEYPVQRRLKVTSSNKTLERIVEISMNAAHRCMHDNIMDCPWRERRQWIGDVQRISLINHYAFGDRDLVRGVLRQHIGMQDPTGRMWCCSPIWEEYPTQSMEWVRAVLEYTEFTGDRSLFEEVSGNIEMLHRWFLRNRDPDGLLFINTPPVMNWMDNPLCHRLHSWQFKVPFVVQNLRYLLFLDDMATCFDATGRPAEAGRVRADRRALEPVIREQFTDAATGLLRDCPDREGAPRTFSVMGHALAVCAGLHDPVEIAKLWDRFQAFSVQHTDDVIPASPFGQFHVHQALARLGRRDAIIADILEKWGPMVEAGADTTWEAFSGETSQCHGWAGIPVISLAGMILGMDPRHSSKARCDHIGGVEWIEAVSLS
ncbi:MAG: hypothetical protein WCS52_13595 [bacterium]